MHLDVSQEPFYAKFTGKMPQTKGAMQTLCEPPKSKFIWIYLIKATLCENLGKCRRPRAQRKFCASLGSGNALGPFTRARLCASLRYRNALGHFTRATVSENIQVKCCRQPARRRLSASLRSRHARRSFTRATLRRPRRDADLVRACAVDMHIDVSHEPLCADHGATQTLCELAQSTCTWRLHTSHFYAEIYRKDAGAQSEHPDEALAFNTYRTNPSVWTPVWEKPIWT